MSRSRSGKFDENGNQTESATPSAAACRGTTSKAEP